jgi:hypothetical protein
MLPWSDAQQSMAPDRDSPLLRFPRNWPSASRGFFQAVSASARTTCGLDYDSGDGSPPLADHWDGSGWSAEMAGLAPPYRSRVSPRFPRRTLGRSDTAPSSARAVFHWNGARWHDVPYPNSSYPLLTGISASSVSDVWVVGSIGGFGGTTFTIHWDGTSWTQVPAPKLGARANALNAVADGSSRRTSAVGRWGYAAGSPSSSDGTARPGRSCERHLRGRSTSCWWRPRWSTEPTPSGFSATRVSSNVLLNARSSRSFAIPTRWCRGACW